MNKQLFLHWAELVDSYRIFPRLVLVAYSVYVYQVTFFILTWYSQQPATARGTEESAVVIAVIGAVTGFSPWIFRIYSENGRNWNEVPAVQTTSITSTHTTTST
jgi:hypothetical protein